MNVDIDLLRRELYGALNNVLAKYEAARPNIIRNGLTITLAGPLQEPYTHKWPEVEDTFREGQWYDVSGPQVPAEGLRILVARIIQNVWGNPARPTAMVFGKLRTKDVAQLTGYVSFAGDDRGTFAAIIPNPAHPRSILKEGDPIPPHLASAIVIRNDKLFDSVKQGPALRLVVQPDDEIAMVEHGVWVASIRKYI